VTVSVYLAVVVSAVLAVAVVHVHVAALNVIFPVVSAVAVVLAESVAALAMLVTCL